MASCELKTSVTLVKSFGREDFERLRFNELGTQLMDLEIRLAMVGRWFMAAVTAMIMTGPAFVWLGGGFLVLRGTVEVGVVVAFVAYIQGRLYGPAASLVGVQTQIVSALAVFERIFGYLDLPTEEYSSPLSAPLSNMRGDIRFECVSFSYDSDRCVLDGVSFHIRAGQVVAFVGPSGSGKSTITKLISRFYDAQNGRITIDGHDIRDIGLESLRRDIGIVSQETHLFHDTIGNNLRYAKPEASLQEVVAAAMSANIHEFVSSLPNGYDTIVGENGHKLSGGERQRLAIARVLLKNPRIVILDEATSSLDSSNEAGIQAAIEVAMRGRTNLVVAHRFSTIAAADMIVVMEKGRAADMGTHATLLARNGLYAELYRNQARDNS